ncbi:MAG TPA: hypothetical protein PKC40_07965 [Saprospiraceae bacterium]|nr:hypothetical protein [Saprospiraceae bacterium]
MSEKNQNIKLDKNRFSAPETVWQKLENSLNEANKLKAGLNNLPVYNAPETVWVKIESDLTEKRPGKLIKLGTFRIAAAILVLLGAGVWIYFSLAEETELISYSTEFVSGELQINDWDEEESAFLMLDQICIEKPFLCEDAEFQLLRRSLNDLTEGKNALKNSLGEINTDPDLIAQLAKIEMERTNILKEMLAYL